MAAPQDNLLVAVQTFNNSGLEFLNNECPIAVNCNKKFENMPSGMPANLGTSFTYALPPRARSRDSLELEFQATEMIYDTLTVNKQASYGFATTSEQLILTYEQNDYFPMFTEAGVLDIASKIEQDLAREFCFSTYRFFGDGVTPISTMLQLNQAQVQMQSFGAVMGQDFKGFMPISAQPQISNSAMNQFTMNRNNDLAYDWEIGKVGRTTWNTSNLLYTHTAGTEGQSDNDNLTISTINTNAAGQIIGFVLSGTHAATDADSMKAGDKMYIVNDGTYPSIFFLTYTGYAVSTNSVQMRVEEDAAASGSSVEVSIYPPLQAAYGKDQNISSQVQVGMKVKVLPSRRCGAIWNGSPFFLSMPTLPDQRPYDSAQMTDKQTGLSLQTYYGTLFGKQQQGYGVNAIWGKSLAQNYVQEVCFPLTN